MVHFVREHRPQYCVPQVIVAGVARQVGEEMLDAVVDVILCGDTFVVPIKE